MFRLEGQASWSEPRMVCLAPPAARRMSTELFRGGEVAQTPGPWILGPWAVMFPSVFLWWGLLIWSSLR